MLIAGESAGWRQCVSRWPEHTASLYGWWMGRSELTNPSVVLAAFASALGGRVLRSGRPDSAVNYGAVLGRMSVEAIRRFSMEKGDENDDEQFDVQDAE